MNAIKVIDFCIQVIPIILMLLGTASGVFQGQGFLGVCALAYLLLMYQFISSISIIIEQSLKQKLSKTCLVRLMLCISLVGLLWLMSVANKNCWSVRDILTFSNKEITDYQQYYILHKENPYVHSVCLQLTALNRIFVTQTIFIFYIMPLFFILTLIERLIDITRSRVKGAV